MAKRPKRQTSARRSKRRVRKSTSGRSIPGWILGLVVLTLTLLLIALWMGRGHRYGRFSMPAYEEERKNGFNLLVDKAEIAIYRSLLQLGVQPSQVRFSKMTHRVQKNKQWDYIELDVSLIDDQNFLRSEKLFAKNLKTLGSKVSWQSRKKTSTNLELLVRVEDILTHRLALSLKVKPHKEEPTPGTSAKLAIVIDDLGYDGRLARQFLEIGAPLSFSVLPHGTFSDGIARRVHEAGRDLLLHLPMEPKGYPEVEPGAGALLVGMTDVEFVQILRKNLDSFPHISGVNNHMGSRLCEHEDKMKLIMQELKARSLFYLDSRTSSETKAYSVARQLNVPSAKRDVFLDNIQSPKAIRSQVNRLVQLAQLRGEAIGIAHPHEATLAVLKETIQSFSGKGVELVPISQIIHR